MTRNFCSSVLFILISVIPSWAQQIKQPVLDAQTRLEFYRQHQGMKKNAVLADKKWTHLGPEIMSGRVTDIAVPHDRPHKFYVATASGGIWVTGNEGTTWQAIYLTQNGKRSCDFQAYVYKSDDHGKSWTDIAEGIPGGPVNVITEDPHRPGVLYVGTDLGVYISTDDGKSWSVLGNELPNTFVHDLKIHARDHVAVIATHGRGIFKLEIAELADVVSQ